jgi:hypothetical protein
MHLTVCSEDLVVKMWSLGHLNANHSSPPDDKPYPEQDDHDLFHPLLSRFENLRIRNASEQEFSEALTGALRAYCGAKKIEYNPAGWDWVFM